MSTRSRLWLGFAGLFAFGLVAVLAAVVRHSAGPLQAWDTAGYDHIRQYGVDHSAWLSAMRVVTVVGATPTVIVVDLCLFGLAMWHRWYRVAALVAVVGIGGWALRIGILNLVRRPRPVHGLWTVDGYSFPSGHTTNATLMLILVAIVVWPLLRSGGRFTVVVGGTVLALAVGLSRITGGVHWPTDVLGGLLLAVGYACAVGALFSHSTGRDCAAAAGEVRRSPTR